MKKIYTLLTALVLILSANAQAPVEDLAVSLDNYTNNQTTSDDPLNLDFTLTNNGDTIQSGDTLYVGLIFNQNYHTITTLQAGSVSGFIFQGDMLPGESQTIPVTNLSMQAIHDTLINYGLVDTLGIQFCVQVLGLGSAALSNPTGNDAVPADNTACVNYLVIDYTEVEENSINSISAYPNPVASVLTIELGNVEADYINIIDMSGRVIETVNVNSQNEMFDVSNLENGIYFYQVVSHGSTLKTEKFIVSK